MDGKNACACKGIRRCLLCEDAHNQRTQDAVESAKVVFVVGCYCSYCKVLCRRRISVNSTQYQIDIYLFRICTSHHTSHGEYRSRPPKASVSEK